MRDFLTSNAKPSELDHLTQSKKESARLVFNLEREIQRNNVAERQANMIAKEKEMIEQKKLKQELKAQKRILGGHLNETKIKKDQKRTNKPERIRKVENNLLNYT